MHRAIVMFAPSLAGEKISKKYIPLSHNEVVMWKLYSK